MFTFIKKHSLVLTLLIVIFVASHWSLFGSQMFFVHDFTHGARISEMTLALQEGQFPVRWVKNLGYGWGMPLFEFYAPLPYYIGAVFYWFGLPLALVIKLLYFLCGLSTIVGAYLCGKYLFDKKAGLLVAASFTLAPYRAVNLFVRGALSEAWAIQFMPWIILYIFRVINQNQKKFQFTVDGLCLTFALTGLLLSHNLTALMFYPTSFALAVIIILLKKVAHRSYRVNHSILKILFSYGMSIGLSSFYVFPAFLEKNFTKIDSILSGYFHYSNHFLYIRQFITPYWGYGGSAYGPNDGLSFFLGYGQLFGFAVALVVLLMSGSAITKKINQSKKTKQFLKTVFKNTSFWHGVTFFSFVGFALLLTTPKTSILWDTVPLLNYIQFPWRWLSIVIMIGSLLIGWSVSQIRSSLIVNVLTVFLFCIFLVNGKYFRPERYVDTPDSLYYQDPEKIQYKMSFTLPDYIPRQVDTEKLHQLVVAEYRPERSDQQVIDSINTLNKKLTQHQNLEVIVDRGHQKLMKTNFDTPQTVSFRVANFPGWNVYLENNKKNDLKSVNEMGNISISVPAGEHLVGLSLEYTPIRLISDVLSIATIGILLSTHYQVFFKKVS